MQKKINLMEALRFSFNMFTKHWKLLASISLISIAIHLGSHLIIMFIAKQAGLSLVIENLSLGIEKGIFAVTWQEGMSITALTAILLIKVISTIILLMIAMGWNRVGLDLHDRGSSNFNRLIMPTSLMISYLLGAFLYSCIVTIGTVLLIIPGIVWAIKYCFFDLFIIDTGCGPIEGLRKSARLTMGHKWQLLGFILAGIGILLLSAITIVGPLLLLYVYFLARIHVFRRLQSAAVQGSGVTSEKAEHAAPGM